jgi:hypothetical protein
LNCLPAMFTIAYIFFDSLSKSECKYKKVILNKKTFFENQSGEWLPTFDLCKNIDAHRPKSLNRIPEIRKRRGSIFIAQNANELAISLTIFLNTRKFF